MRLQSQQNLEDLMYDFLKSIDMPNKLADFGDATPEAIAKEITEGYKEIWLGQFCKLLDGLGGVPNFEFMCQTAFYDAMIRIAKERPTT